MRIIIDECHEGIILREYIRNIMGMSRNTLTVMKNRDDGIVVNGRSVTVRYILRAGDELTLKYEDEGGSENIPANYELLERIGIAYEDEYILAVNKPPEMPTHPSLNHHGDTLANAVAAYYEKKGIKSLFRAVNRLDRDTSGIVIVAKDKVTASKLGGIIHDGGTEKSYTAICEGGEGFDIGNTEKIGEVLRISGGIYEYDAGTRTGRVTAPIRRERESIIKRICAADGSYAMTEFRLRAETDGRYLFEVKPKTGRTHQIRVHFGAMGCPLAGDFLYNERYIAGHSGIDAARHMLHAGGFHMVHPYSGVGLDINCPPPGDMLGLIRNLFGELT